MALAIGASTTIFSVVHAVLLKPLPFPHPDRLVMIWNVYGENRTANSPPDYFDRLDSSRLLEHIAAFRFTSFNLIGAGEPERLEGAQVAASFFPALGVNPLHGRVFLPEEDRPGNDDAVVLSHGCWTRRFGADPDVLGETVRLNDRVFRITGVMPPSFQLVFPDIEIWAPIAFGPEARSDQNRGNEYLSVIARMRPGTTLEQAEAEMETIAAAVLEKVPSRRDFLLTADWSADVVPLREHYAGDLRPVVQVLFGAVALVFSIGCVNIANLLLAQGTTREKEFSIRSALGAGRGRMVRQLLAENLCLAMVGGTLGILLAWWGIRVLSTLGTVSPLLAAADLHFEVLTFAAGLMVATSFVFGLIPAMQSSSPRILEGLRGAGQASARLGSQTLRRVLVISEVALALLLLVAAGLLIRSAQHLSEVPTDTRRSSG